MGWFSVRVGVAAACLTALFACKPKIAQFDVSPLRACLGDTVAIGFKVSGTPSLLVTRRGDSLPDTIGSLSEVLHRADPRPDIPRPPSIRVQAVLELGAPAPPHTPMQLAFANAATRMVQDHPRETAQKYPEVSHWVLAQQQK